MLRWVSCVSGRGTGSALGFCYGTKIAFWINIQGLIPSGIPEVKQERLASWLLRTTSIQGDAVLGRPRGGPTPEEDQSHGN